MKESSAADPREFEANHNSHHPKCVDPSSVIPCHENYPKLSAREPCEKAAINGQKKRSVCARLSRPLVCAEWSRSAGPGAPSRILWGRRGGGLVLWRLQSADTGKLRRLYDLRFKFTLATFKYEREEEKYKIRSQLEGILNGFK